MKLLLSLLLLSTLWANEKLIKLDMDELKLMYQVFIYDNELDNAYDTALRAYKQAPNSLYWNRKLAQVTKWLGKSNESMKYSLFVYKITHDEALEEEIINYAMKAYQYENARDIIVKRAKKEPNEKNIEAMIFIYDMVGTPQYAAIELERLYTQQSKQSFLEKALQIYLNVGDIPAASRVVSKLEKNRIPSIQSANLMAQYYFTKHKLDKSYQALLSIETRMDSNNSSYFTQLSDLAWYMQEYNQSALASDTLIRENQGRLVDYERVIYFAKTSDSTLAALRSLEAYNRYKKSYLFFSYAYDALDKKRYDELRGVITKIDRETDNILKRDALYWLITAQVHQHYKENTEVIKALKIALTLNPDSNEIQITTLWFLMDNNYDEALKKAMFKIEEESDIDPQLYVVLAASHFHFQESDRALEYIFNLLQHDSKNLDLKLLYAYILQTQADDEAFMNQMLEMQVILDETIAKNPLSLRDKLFLDKYLRVTIYTQNPDDFEEILRNAKPYVSNKTYNDIYLFWALKISAYEKANYIVHHLESTEPWMELSIALNFNDISRNQEILYKHFTTLPIRDRVAAALSSGNISLAQTLAFEGMQKNQYDYLLFQQNRALAEANVNQFQAKSGYYNRASLEQWYLKANDYHYINDGYALLTQASSAKNTTLNSTILATTPYYDNLFSLGLRKKLTRGYIEANIYERFTMLNYSGFNALINYQLSNRVTVEAEAHINQKAEETTYLLLGGKKDGFKLRGNLQLLNSTSLTLSYEQNTFSSLDNYALGSGYAARIESETIVRLGYPDLTYKLFYDFGEFKESSGSRGIIDYLQPIRTRALPNHYYNIGASIHYGLANKNTYVRTWRPYAEFIPYYNGEFNQVNFAMSAGYSGRIYNHDQLLFGLDYNQAVNGTQETLLELFVQYKLLY